MRHCAITALITNSINTVLSAACPRATTLEATFSASRAAPAPGWCGFALCRYEIFYRTQQLAAVSTIWQGKQPGMRESLFASPLKICPNLVVRKYQKTPGPACDAADAGEQPSPPCPQPQCPSAPRASQCSSSSRRRPGQSRFPFPPTVAPRMPTHEQAQLALTPSWAATSQEGLVPQAWGLQHPQHPAQPPSTATLSQTPLHPQPCTALPTPQTPLLPPSW